MSRYHLRPGVDVAGLNRLAAGHLPGWFGVEVVSVEPGRLSARLPIRSEMLAPNGFLHAATIVALADTSAGYATIAHLPAGAEGFTTVELKTNFLGTLTDGMLLCEATAAHAGRTTQVWDAAVSSADGRRLALFRCTQMVLWPRVAALSESSDARQPGQ
ncbi:MAG TPA: PaaI family thioesterase [Candidatus Accumulibacter phosphatis]|nr:MAG: putative esterase [Candidatus Accumulibacter sp. SK-11]HAY26496.1 PaaI family thioesterase [Accumulibacter sp.]HRL76234.1 PaaI family thioesterase [Candidatus Accumulibacter phosphatis]HCN69732.1 PaaI family thioesterase [Accumulibacter sp.]HCV14622.1 PaaI family thioesterase [Accumulibacter sp.]